MTEPQDQHSDKPTESGPSKLRVVWEYLSLALINATASGCHFGWAVLQSNALSNGWASGSTMAVAYIVGLLSYTVCGMLFSLFGVVQTLSRLSYAPAQLLFGIIFLVGIIFLCIGINACPPLVYPAQVLMCSAASMIYSASYTLLGRLPRGTISITVGYSISTSIYQLTTIPVHPEIMLAVWAGLHFLVTILNYMTFYEKQESEQRSVDSDPCSQTCKKIQHSLVSPAVWICSIIILLTIGNQSYFFQSLYQRLTVFDEKYHTMINLMLTLSQVCSMVAGLFHLLPMVYANLVFAILLLTFGISLIVPPNLYVFIIMLFVMSISATGIIISSMAITVQRTGLYESNALCFLGMIFGNIIGYILTQFATWPYIDYIGGSLPILACLLSIVLLVVVAKCS
ncbi:hypothetical protein GMRT_13942 [Giardia muris]|uniref:Uncharacterized protein n=1 Tax=Giardia muris TaxID=5742 RepID=A0A4Z1SLF2_GIAMU|nr:hypothetical protein GMRT_13942 [Giardia muris]|eukprot:TNJ26474.1 hypothetical protein GMRT_13942 [Giardia muris]